MLVGCYATRMWSCTAWVTIIEVAFCHVAPHQAHTLADGDRSRLLLYFAAYVPGGLEAADAAFLLRLPIFPGVAHSAEAPAWRRLAAAAAGDAAVCAQSVLQAVCGGWAALPLALQVLAPEAQNSRACHCAWLLATGCVSMQTLPCCPQVYGR